MANRVLDAGDVATRPWATVGDILIDTATSVHADGKLKVELTDADTTFSTARTGATIWIDGSIGEFYHLRIRANSASDLTVWSISSDPDNYVHIKPVPGTQVVCKRNASSNSGFLALFANFKYVYLDGENDAYPGLRDGWPGVFLTGKFGFFFSNDVYPEGGHTLSISSPPDGHFKIKGTEHFGGFSGIRFAGTSYAMTVKISVTRSYLHDAGDGEGFYLGSTQAYPYVLLKCELDDVVIARRACEGIQVQHIISGVGENNTIQHFVNYCPAMDGLKAFQGGQDTAIQQSQASGGNVMKNGVVDGSRLTSVGYNHFGTVDYPDLTVDSTVPSVAENIVFHRIGGILSYIHNSNISGVWKLMRKLYLANFSNAYYADDLNTLADYYVSANNGTDRFSWIDITHDGVKNNFFQDSSDHEYIDITEDTLDAVEYVNSGFPEPTSEIMNWKATYGNYHDNATTDKPVEYQAGWVVCNIEQGVEYAFYKVMSTHTTTGVGALNPRQDIAANGNVRFKKLTWDTAGVRNLDINGNTNGSWNSGTAQSLIPPDDLRLAADNYWNKRGMGLRANPQNTDYTQYQWFRNTTNSPSGAVAIPGAKTRFYTPQDVDSGYFIALGVKARDALGNYDSTFRYSNWTLVS